MRLFKRIPRPSAATVRVFVASLSLFCHLKHAPAGEAPTGKSKPLLSRYVVNSRTLPPVLKGAQESVGIVAQDGGLSIPLPDGNSFWTFGDSLTGHWRTDGSPKWTGAVSNCICWVSPREGKIDIEYKAERGAVVHVLPLHETESWEKHRIWPFGGIHIGGKTYLYYGLVCLTGEGTFGIESGGTGLAVAEGTSWEFRRLIMPKAKTPLEVEPHALVLRDGFVYLFYVKKRGMVKSVYAARVPTDKLASPEAYTYWRGPKHEFDSSSKQAKPLVTDTGQVPSVVWNEYLASYVMIHVGGALSNPRTIYMRTAAEPCGPWSEPVTAFHLDGKLGEGFTGLLYCPLLHPVLFRDNGRIMVFTYCEIEDFGNPKTVEIELRKRR
jgi:hypothetical protein